MRFSSGGKLAGNVIYHYRYPFGSQTLRDELRPSSSQPGGEKVDWGSSAPLSYRKRLAGVETNRRRISCQAISPGDTL
jgi:hypothetical protein